MIKWDTALSAGDVIKFAGNPKYNVIAIASDPESIASYGLREKIIRDNSIEDVTTARRRAIAELEAYKDEVSDVSFKTYTSGLRTGMVINLTSTERNCNLDFLIKRVQFVAINPNEFSYTVQLVTTRRYGLIEILQKLMEPENVSGDENEISEIIKTDFVDINILEEITAVKSRTVEESISIAESITKDPFGANTAPDFVLAPYIPTSVADPKREGLLDRSMIVY
jgi:hypothetical protein